MPIAIVPFEWRGSSQLPEDLAAIIAADLMRSGRFKALAERDMLSRPTQASDINFRSWQALGQENLVIGQVREAGPNKYIVQFQLFDVFRGTQLTGYQIPSGGDELRRTAHRISDIIYQQLTGEPGAFTSRIAYVTLEQPAANKRLYKLQIADTDGHNPQTVITSPEPIMSPAWAPDGKRIAYVSFENKAPAIFIQTLATGQRQQVSAAPGINGAPAWSPDGSQLAITLSKEGSPDIYILNLIARSLRRLTQSYAIDTEPTWSPDGRTLVFTSDRGGKPQLYAIPASGGQARRLTFEGDYNARGTFSPDGRSLAMVHGSGGSYRIAVLDLKTRALRVLTKGRLDESPSFAPNGSMILYASKEAGSGQLSAVSFDGRVHQRLRLESGEVREPAWSPL